MSKRVVLIVLDSVGVGELPDAADYGDVGANTLLNIKEKVPEMTLPNMCQMGLSHIQGVEKIGDKVDFFTGSCGKLAEVSLGKDTTTGHWEISGLKVEHPFPTYPQGFPQDLIGAFEEKVGRKVIGNCVASGTEIISRLGDEHVATGDLIIYTSADSVFQIAAHEDIVPIEELLHICQIAREMLVDDWNVSRVIARPFVGESKNYTRTANRKDYSVAPFAKTMLDYIKEAGLAVNAIGKISDIYDGQGITKSTPTKDNGAGIDATLAHLQQESHGLIFTNLVDFDSVYGHRRDYKGYAKALMDFDKRLPEILGALKEEDILMMTADHGCDPTFKGTDHTREYVPLLVYGKTIKSGINLGIRSTFSDIGKTILDYLGIDGKIEGESFLNEIAKE
ncbi:MAG: phosphopentomutase [Defluviitaleaceae bacterium]|nr:phosphopentomutase [Defluviitaleaceae bacterium]